MEKGKELTIVTASQKKFNNFVEKSTKFKSMRGVEYLDIKTVYSRLDKLFGAGVWYWVIDSFQHDWQSVTVVGHLEINGRRYQSGIGSAPLQFDSYFEVDGQGKPKIDPTTQHAKTTRQNRYDQQALKNNAFQLAYPTASSQALKNAAGKIGRYFGRNLNNKDGLDDIEEEPRDEAAAQQSKQRQNQLKNLMGGKK